VAKSKELLWNVGEGILSDDLNAMQRFLRAQTHDIWRSHAGQSEIGGAGLNPFVVYSHRGGGAPRGTGVARQLGNTAGWIAITQELGVTGDAPDFLYYYVDTDEMAVTLDAGHATDHRTDILCVKLDYLEGDAESRHQKNPTTGVKSTSSINKRRNVRLEFQLVKGTDSAVFPGAQPSVPLGYKKLAAVYVPPTFNAAINAGNILDYTMPVGLQYIDVPAHQWARIDNSDSVTTWVHSKGILGYFSGANTAAYAICNPHTNNLGRIIGVGFGGRRLASSAATLELVRIDMLPEGGSSGTPGWADAVISLDYDANTILPPAAGDVQYHELSLMTGEPIWTNGYRAGAAMSGFGGSPPFISGPPYSPMAIPKVALHFEADGTRQDEIMFARFIVAGGL
jgi:hypothetical protein